MYKVTLEELEASREKRLGRYNRSTEWLMMPEKRGGKLGKRPVGVSDQMLRRCPGSSQHKGLDFVRGVYAERTGQE